MSDSRVFIHAGSAHLDEIFAVALLMLVRPGLVGASIVRVQEVPADFNPDSDWMVDVGMVFEPTQNRFDHHQLSAPEGLCAAGLLLRELDSEFFRFLMRDRLDGGPSWFKVLNEIDTQGPFAFKKKHGALTSDAFGPALTKMVERGEVRAAIDIACQIVGEWWTFFQEEKILEKEVRNMPVAFRGINGVGVAFLESSNPKHSAILARLLDWEEQDPAILVTFDDRGPGMCVFRRGDHPAVNLSSLAGHEAVEFAHKGGFIAKTKVRMSPQEVIALIAPCIKSA